MIIKEKLKPSANQAFIIFSMLWIVLFVWYGPELGILSVGGKLDLELQNIYLVIYSICAFSFTFLFKAEDYIIASKIGTVGTLAGFIMVISDAFPLFTLIGVIVMAVFSSAFSMGIFYLYLYVLTSKEQQQTAVFIIAVNAVSQFISSIGLSDMQDPIYNTLSIILLVMIFMCTMGLKKVNYNIQYQTKNKQVPGIALYGALLIVVTVQFLNGVAVIVLHYRSFNEASGYMFFYARQFLAAVMAYILLV
ncbi:MAG TPA: hypothetical protein GXX69_07825, partial [Firmicutes bacterium]|nr:hypothetical protein [Bacillota bacterium]